VSKSSNRPSSYNVVLSFGHHEWNLVTRTASLIKYLFGNIPHVCQRKTTWTVEIGKASLGLLLQELCGNRASNKRVPEFLFRAPSRVVETFLDAFAKGDGCETNGHLSLNTISETLAMGLYALYLRLGHLPSFNIWDAPVMTAIEGRLVSQSTLYYVKLRLKRMREGSWRTAKHVRYEFGEHDIRVPIHRIDQVPYSGPVYNLEVDDRAHTYAANFIAVGNCQIAILRFCRLKVGGLSGGERQMVAMGRALMLDPCLLLLDEPSAGLAPVLVDTVFEKIEALNRNGLAILLVEQSAREALRRSHRGYVLAGGQVRLEGPGPALLEDAEVARLYLGG